MKFHKKLLFFLIVGIMAMSVMAFSACNDATNDPCTQHVDADSDGKCDICGEDIPGGGETEKFWLNVGGFYYDTPGTASSEAYYIFHEDGTYYTQMFGTPGGGVYSFSIADGSDEGTITIDAVEYRMSCKDPYYYNGVEDIANEDGRWIIYDLDYSGYPSNYFYKADLELEEMGYIAQSLWVASDETGNSKIELSSDKTFFYMVLDEDKTSDPDDPQFITVVGNWVQNADLTYTLFGDNEIDYTLTVTEEKKELTYNDGSKDVTVGLSATDPSINEVAVIAMTGVLGVWGMQTSLTLYDSGRAEYACDGVQQYYNGTWEMNGNNYVITWKDAQFFTSETMTITVASGVYSTSYVMEIQGNTLECSFTWEAPKTVLELKCEEGGWLFITCTLISDNTFTFSASMAGQMSNETGTWTKDNDGVYTITFNAGGASSGKSYTLTETSGTYSLVWDALNDSLGSKTLTGTLPVAE